MPVADAVVEASAKDLVAAFLASGAADLEAPAADSAVLVAVAAAVAVVAVWVKMQTGEDKDAAGADRSTVNSPASETGEELHLRYRDPCRSPCATPHSMQPPTR